MDMEFFDSTDERCLLGAMFINNSIIESVYNSLKPDAFYDTKNRMIYETMLSLRSRGIVADLSTVYSELGDKVGVAYIAGISDETFTSANWNYYAEHIRNSYLKRQAYHIALKMKSSLEENKKNVNFQAQELVNEVVQQITDMTKNVTGAKYWDMRDLIKSEVEYLQECFDNKKAWLGYDTGFIGLNDIINGLQPVYMVIGARPSMGKTALAQKIALNISKHDKVAFIELEMSPRQLTERAISNLTKIPFRRIQSGFITTDGMAKLTAKMDELAQNKNFIPCECPTRQLSDIVNICRFQVRNNGAKVIFIDHIGLIRCNLNAQSFEKTRYISNTLQQLQRELEVPIVVLSQLGRESETGKSSLASFRGSGAIEEDADICILINRDRAESESDTDIKSDVVVAKNRDGAVGVVKMLFKPEIVDFVDVSETYQERKELQKLENVKTVPEKLVEPKKEPEPSQGVFDGFESDNDSYEYDIY